MKKTIVIFALLIAGILSSSVLKGCSNTDTPKVEKESAVSNKTIEQVQDAYTKEWMNISGVEGTGIGLCEGKPCIIIFSSKAAEELKGKIPATVEGYPVVIEETGTFSVLEQDGIDELTVNIDKKALTSQPAARPFVCHSRKECLGGTVIGRFKV